MSYSILQLNFITLSCLAIFVFGILSYLGLHKRKAEDVLNDLGEYSLEKLPDGSERKAKDCTFFEREKKQGKEFNFINTLSESERIKLKKKLLNSSLIWFLLSIICGVLFFTTNLLLLLFLGFSGLCFGYLFSQRKQRLLEKKFKKDIIYFLPIVMERIVMAVQAGLDILPALKAIEEIECLAISAE